MLASSGGAVVRRGPCPLGLSDGLGPALAATSLPGGSRHSFATTGAARQNTPACRPCGLVTAPRLAPARRAAAPRPPRRRPRAPAAPPPAAPAGARRRAPPPRWRVPAPLRAALARAPPRHRARALTRPAAAPHAPARGAQASRLIANFIVMAAGTLIRAGSQAYRQAIISAWRHSRRGARPRAAPARLRARAARQRSRSGSLGLARGAAAAALRRCRAPRATALLRRRC
jgi:hypothetical protein